MFLNDKSRLLDEAITDLRQTRQANEDRAFDDVLLSRSIGNILSSAITDLIVLGNTQLRTLSEKETAAIIQKKPSPKKAKKSAPAKKSHHQKPAAKPKPKKKLRPPKGALPQFMAPLYPDAALTEIVGSKPLPRTEITKRLWDYIQKHKLQDQKNRRQINADDKLRPIFGKASVSMFEMNQRIQKHLSKSAPAKSAPAKKSHHKKTAPAAAISNSSVKSDKVEISTGVGRGRGRPKKEIALAMFEQGPSFVTGNFYTSEALHDLIGIQYATRGTIQKAVWKYIADHDLKSGDEISPDTHLARLTGMAMIPASELNNHLDKHLSTKPFPTEAAAAEAHHETA